MSSQISKKKNLTQNFPTTKDRKRTLTDNPKTRSEIDTVYQYKNMCDYLCRVPGIRFAAIINKNGRKIAGGINPKILPLERNEQKLEMLFMEIALDLSMRKEFNESLGKIQAIVSYRERTNIITIPHQDNLLLLSSYPELESHKVIHIAYQNLEHCKIDVRTN